MFVIPEFRRDPELFAAEASTEEALQHLADPVFIPVDRCAIEVPVAGRNRAFDCLRDPLRRYAIGTERAKTNRGNLRARVQRSLGHACGIDRIAGNGRYRFRSWFHGSNSLR